MKSKKEYLLFLDIGKGLGIIFVLIAHSCSFPGGGDLYNRSFYAIILFFIGIYI